MTLLKSAILSVETARLYKLKILPITMARRTQLTFKTYHIYGKIQEEEGSSVASSSGSQAKTIDGVRLVA